MVALHKAVVLLPRSREAQLMTELKESTMRTTIWSGVIMAVVMADQMWV